MAHTPILDYDLPDTFCDYRVYSKALRFAFLIKRAHPATVVTSRHAWHQGDAVTLRKRNPCAPAAH